MIKTRYLEADAMALRQSWGIYLVLAVIPPLAMIGMIFYLIFDRDPFFGPRVVEESTATGWIWFVLGMLWISVTLPAGFYVRRHYWARFYEGGTVRARNYIKGNVAIWLPLVVAGVLGFIGFAATRFAGSLFTSVTAFVIFLAMYPTGHAMTRPVGDHDDPGVYEEPK